MTTPLTFPIADVDVDTGNIGHVSVEYMREQLMGICDKIESGEYIRSNVHVVAETVHNTVELFRSVNQPVYDDPETMTVACIDAVTIKIPDDQQLVDAYDHFVEGATLGFFHLCGQGIRKADERIVVYTNEQEVKVDDNHPYALHRPYSRWSAKKWESIDEEHRQLMDKYANRPPEDPDGEHYMEMMYLQEQAERYDIKMSKQKQMRKDSYAK